MAKPTTETSWSEMAFMNGDGIHHVKTVREWPQDAEHAPIGVDGFPRIQGSTCINLSDSIGKHFLTHFNMSLPRCVKVVNSTTVSVQKPKDEKRAECDLLHKFRKMVQESGCSADASCSNPVTIAAPAYMVDGEPVRVYGPCVRMEELPDASAYGGDDDVIIEGVKAMWVCNGDAIPFHMSKTERAGMEGHTVIVETSDMIIMVCKHISSVDKMKDEHITHVWGGNTCTSDVFNPVIFTTKRVFETCAGDPSGAGCVSLGSWQGVCSDNAKAIAAGLVVDVVANLREVRNKQASIDT